MISGTVGTVPFHMRHELRQRPLVASEHPLNEIHWQQHPLWRGMDI